MTAPAPDPLLRRATEVVLTTQFCSVSHLMRRLGVGFGRGVQLVNALEENGVVGPLRAFESREVLVRADRLDEVLAQLGVSE